MAALQKWQEQKRGAASNSSNGVRQNTPLDRMKAIWEDLDGQNRTAFHNHIKSNPVTLEDVWASAKDDDKAVFLKGIDDQAVWDVKKTPKVDRMKAIWEDMSPEEIAEFREWMPNIGRLKLPRVRTSSSQPPRLRQLPFRLRNSSSSAPQGIHLKPSDERRLMVLISSGCPSQAPLRVPGGSPASRTSLGSFVAKLHG